MPTNYPFIRDDILPSFWANAIQEMISSLGTGIKVEKADDQTLRVPAGAGNAQAGLTIDGLWRYITATKTVAHPGGAAGTYQLWATCRNNSVTSDPDPFTDHTDYSFGLVITTAAATPPIITGSVDHFRKLSDVVWDGTRITQLIPVVGVWGALPSFVFYLERTYTLSGPVVRTDNLTGGTADPSWTLPFRVPLLAPNQQVSLIAAWGELQGGGSATAKVRRKPWGGAEADLSADWQGLVFGANEREYLPTPVALAHRDRIRPEITAVGTAAVSGQPAGTPANLDLTLGFKYTILPG